MDETKKEIRTTFRETVAAGCPFRELMIQEGGEWVVNLEYIG